MFGRARIQREYQSLIAEIENGSPRPVKHDPPETLEAAGTTFHLTEHNRVVFRDFEPFGEVFNWLGGTGPWVLEEKPSPLLTDLEDGPDYGRNYRVFFNNVEMGTFLVGPYLLDDPPSARGVIDIQYLQFVPYSEAHGLLFSLGVLFGAQADGEQMRSAANIAATAALSAYSWEVIRKSDRLHDFEYRFVGPYGHFSELAERHSYRSS